ncbi:hypothetical protein [Bdellovibrio bacteriovorus]|uniref:Transposase n=1 Tax=Bdellovibrio bacteriovorus str. Tiberius TaxID=1069642 RepID=K7Z6W9_BDEBC|nr:hypothetical protein [Bdellovibrio bacteriovorus]AFX99943.1 Hypothetical protein Bdt_0235 [Bdellovibrio bacteriovorus str. Tiberius]
MARHPKDTTPKLTDQLIETIAQAIRVGSYVETAVALAGVSKDSFYRWLRQAESDDSTLLTVKLSDAVKKALAESEKRDLDVIDKAAQEGEWTAAAWRLERKFPNKWGRQSKVQLEHTGMDGGPIEIQSMTEDEMETRIEKLLQKRTVLIED